MAESFEHGSFVRRKALLNPGAVKESLAFGRRQIPHIAERPHDFFPLDGPQLAPFAENPPRFLPLSRREPGKDLFPFAELFFPLRRQVVPAMQVFTNPFLALWRQALKPLIVRQHAFLLLGRQVAQAPEKAWTGFSVPRLLAGRNQPPASTGSPIAAPWSLAKSRERWKHEGGKNSNPEDGPEQAAAPPSLQALTRVCHDQFHQPAA